MCTLRRVKAPTIVELTREKNSEHLFLGTHLNIYGFFFIFFLSQTVAFISFVSFYVHAFSLYHHKSYKYFRSSVVDVFRAPQWPISSDLVRKIYFRLTPVTHFGGGGRGAREGDRPDRRQFFFLRYPCLVNERQRKAVKFFRRSNSGFLFRPASVPTPFEPRFKCKAPFCDFCLNVL